MANMNEIQDQLIEDFGFLEDWEDKYGYLIDLAKSLQPLTAEQKVAENVIKG
jgi:cysteine desulfuration protein SufE